MPLKHMKKMLFAFMLMFVTISASAQIVVMNNTNSVRLDLDGDGQWDQEVSVQGIPGITYMKTGRNFYSELGRVYVINMWKQYERMGVNPANYLPNPGSNADFSQYAGYYARYIGGGMMGGGMVAPMAGMPGQASISVGGKNFGVSLSVPVRSANSGYGYTPNASVGVSVNGNYVGASVPVTVVTGKKKAQRTVAQPRTVAPVQPQRTVQPQTQTPTREVKMSVSERQQMLNSGDYM